MGKLNVALIAGLIAVVCVVLAIAAAIDVYKAIAQAIH